MTARQKKQCILRFYADEYDRIRKKAQNDGINYQQLGDVLFGAYLRNNKHINQLVKKAVGDKTGTGRQLTESEKNELFRLVENESPIVKLEKAFGIGKNEK